MEKPANRWQVACAKTCRQVCIAFAPFSRAPTVNDYGNPATPPTSSPKLTVPPTPRGLPAACCTWLCNKVEPIMKTTSTCNKAKWQVLKAEYE